MNPIMPEDKDISINKANRLFVIPPFNEQLMFWSVVVAGVALDLWSKFAVHKWLLSLDSREYSLIDGFLKFVIRENTGAAFSIAQGQRIMLVSVSVVAMVVVVCIFLMGNMKSKLMVFTLAIFLAGVVGNLYDRAFNCGKVRDFIDVYYNDWHWPAFNVADSLLCIAVGIFIITNFTSQASQKPDCPQKSVPQDQQQ